MRGWLSVHVNMCAHMQRCIRSSVNNLRIAGNGRFLATFEKHVDRFC